MNDGVIQNLLAWGQSQTEIATMLGISSSSVYRARKRIRAIGQRDGFPAIVPLGCDRKPVTVTENRSRLETGHSDRKPVNPPPGTALAPKIPTPTPIPNGPDSRSRNRKEVRTLSRSSDFDAFWKAYPKKTGKIKAQSLYAAAVKRGVEHATIMAGVSRYVAKIERERTPAQYIAGAVPWLNQGRWDDEEAVEVQAKYSGTEEELRERYQESF